MSLLEKARSAAAATANPFTAAVEAGKEAYNSEKRKGEASSITEGRPSYPVKKTKVLINTEQPQFWMMVSSIVIAICFIVLAIALIAVAITVRRVTATVRRVEESVEPLLRQVNAITVQGREMSTQFTEIATNLSAATSTFRNRPSWSRKRLPNLGRSFRRRPSSHTTRSRWSQTRSTARIRK